MSKNYDNWEKLVGAVLRKEQLKQLALSHSRDSSSITDDEFSSFNSISTSVRFHYHSVVYKGQRPQLLAHDFDLMNIDDPKIISRFVPPKRVFLPVEAREFIISSGDLPERQFAYSMYRLTEVVEVNSVLSLDIRGKIKTRLLSPNTIYGAYLVLSAENLEGLESAEAMIRFVDDDETNADAEIVQFQAVDERNVEMTVRGSDGWMEVQIGNFYVDEGDNGEVEVRLVKTSRLIKTSLVVEGIEFRPLVCVKEV